MRPTCGALPKQRLHQHVLDSVTLHTSHHQTLMFLSPALEQDLQVQNKVADNYEIQFILNESEKFWALNPY